MRRLALHLLGLTALALAGMAALPVQAQSFTLEPSAALRCLMQIGRAHV